AAAPRGWRDRRRAEAGRVVPRALVVAEEKQALGENRPAEGSAGNVLLALLFRRPRSIVLPGVRVEIAVPVELEGTAAERVGSRFQDARDDGAADVAGIGRVVVRLDADLGQRVRARLVGDAVVDRLVDVEAVDGEVVRLLPIAVHEWPVRIDRADVREAARIVGHGAGQEQRQLRRVAAVERQGLYRGARDDLADGRGLGLQDRRQRFDLHRLLELTHGHLQVEARDLV